MSLPGFTSEGSLPPGIHLAPLSEVEVRFGSISTAREGQTRLLRAVVDAALPYPFIKRVLLWGSFVTAKAEPNDLDYSVVVSVDHHRTRILPDHRRFFIPYDAKLYYGADRGFLVIRDYPLGAYAERLDFLCHTRSGQECGIVEISLRGEFGGSDNAPE